MTKTDRFINSVLAHVPVYFPSRDQITIDLRTHIEDRITGGASLDEAIDRMGDPRAIAAELLQDYMPVPASLWDRFGAFWIDAFVFLPIVRAIWLYVVRERSSAYPELSLVLSAVLVVVACIIPEWLTGKTLGKYFFGLHVQRLSGSRINLLQGFLRRLLWFQPYLAVTIDAILVFTTVRRQRLLDVIMGTIVVADDIPPMQWKKRIGRCIAAIIGLTTAYWLAGIFIVEFSRMKF